MTTVPAETKIWPHVWFYRVMTLKGQCHLRRSTIFCTKFVLYQWVYMWSFIEILLAVSLEKWRTVWHGKERRKKERRKIKGVTLWRMLTLCDAHYVMEEWLDVNVPYFKLKISSWTFIWHKLCLNTLSRYGDRATVTLPKIGLNIRLKFESGRSWLYLPQGLSGIICKPEGAARGLVKTLLSPRGRWNQ